MNALTCRRPWARRRRSLDGLLPQPGVVVADVGSAFACGVGPEAEVAQGQSTGWPSRPAFFQASSRLERSAPNWDAPDPPWVQPSPYLAARSKEPHVAADQEGRAVARGRGPTLDSSSPSPFQIARILAQGGVEPVAAGGHVRPLTS